MSRNTDRRHAPRVSAGFPARLWHDVGWQQVWCEDVSRRGLGLSVFRRSPAEGERVRVSLQLPGGTVDVHGHVVREGAFPGSRLGVRLECSTTALEHWVEAARTSVAAREHPNGMPR